MIKLIQKEIRYLGHASPEVVTADPEKLEAVQRWSPSNKHVLRSVVVYCTHNRSFIAGFADIAEPLTQITKERDLSVVRGGRRRFLVPERFTAYGTHLSDPRRGEIIVYTDTTFQLEVYGHEYRTARNKQCFTITSPCHKQNCPKSRSAEEVEGSTRRDPQRTYGTSPRCEQDSRQSETAVLLATSEEPLSEVMPTMRLLRSKAKSPNQEPEPDASGNVDAPFEGVATDIARSIPESE
jgi:hypothetical protein